MSYSSHILVQQLQYLLPTQQKLFDNLSLSITASKTGLIGKNGCGKSTLLKLILGELQPSAGSIEITGKIAYLSQQLVINPNATIAQILGIDLPLKALERILQGSIDLQDYALLNDDWTLAERTQKRLATFGLDHLSLQQTLQELSGGEQTRLALFKIFNSDATILLIDEPTNHLDAEGRQLVYQQLSIWQGIALIATHDRALLEKCEQIIELSSLGAQVYGGNYSFYKEQKAIAENAAQAMLQARNEILDKAKQVMQIRKERHQQNVAKGKQAKYDQIQAKGSYNKIELKAKQGRSERTNRRIRLQADRKMDALKSQLQIAKEKIAFTDTIKIALPKTFVPNGKILLEIENLTFTYPNQTPLIQNFNWILSGATRVALTGNNGSGKTTLLKLILNELKPSVGTIQLGTAHISYLDQHASLLNREQSVLENFIRLNPNIKEQEAYHCLAQFLFKNVNALKLVKALSGGEKLRALLACVLLAEHPPQLLILDEPTNHLDLVSITSIESALNCFEGALIVISHDATFLENIGIHSTFTAPFLY